MISRNTLDDWNEYKKTLQDWNDYDQYNSKFSFFASLDVEKDSCENLEEAKRNCNFKLLELFSRYGLEKEIHCNFSLDYTNEKKNRTFNPKSLVFSWNLKCEEDEARPYVEPGAPALCSELLFNRINLRRQVIKERGSVQRKTNKHPEEKKIRNDIANDRYDKFYQLISLEESDDLINSYRAIHKQIEDPIFENIVHYLNNEYFTFVFQSAKSNDWHLCNEYFNYVTEKFNLPFDYHYGRTAVLKYDPEKDKRYKSQFNWKVNKPYHLFDNYYAMTIDGVVTKLGYDNLFSGDINYFINKFIEDFSSFDFDWNLYPGNLYFGNVCKVLT